MFPCFSWPVDVGLGQEVGLSRQKSRFIFGWVYSNIRNAIQGRDNQENNFIFVFILLFLSLKEFQLSPFILEMFLVYKLYKFILFEHLLMKLKILPDKMLDSVCKQDILTLHRSCIICTVYKVLIK